VGKANDMLAHHRPQQRQHGGLACLGEALVLLQQGGQGARRQTPPVRCRQARAALGQRADPRAIGVQAPAHARSQRFRAGAGVASRGSGVAREQAARQG